MSYKIALVRPNYDSLFVAPHLGLGYLSSCLKSHGIEVLLLDALKSRLNRNQILTCLVDNEINIAGITCLTAYYKEAIELSLFLKENGIRVIIGGVHPTFLPYQTLIESKADYVICGEGEVSLVRLMKNIISDKEDISEGGGGGNHRCVFT